jgi:hypothetical protein
VNDVANLSRGFSLEIRKLRPNTEKMAVSRRDFYSRKNKEIVDGQSVQAHQAFLEKVIDHIAGVMIGDGDAVQTFGTRSRNQVFRAGNTVTGKKRMRVQVDIKWHGSNRTELKMLQALQS